MVLKSKQLFSILLAAAVLVAAALAYWQFNQQPVVNENQNGNQNTNTATTTEEIDTTNWKTYRNEEYGFEFKYPEDTNLIWFKQSQEKQKTILSGFLNTTKESDPFRGGKISITAYRKLEIQNDQEFDSQFELEKFNNCFYEKDYQYKDQKYRLVVGCVPIKFDVANFMKVYNKFITTINLF